MTDRGECRLTVTTTTPQSAFQPGEVRELSKERPSTQTERVLFFVLLSIP